MKSHESLSQFLVPNAHNALVLSLYVLLLVVVTKISLQYRRKSLERMVRPLADAPALTLEEMAFLSGGVQRIMQLAIFRLYYFQLFTCETRWLKKTFKPVASDGFDASRLTTFEQTLYDVSRAKGKLLGMDDSNFRAQAKPHIERIETKLAISGYRPKESERTIVGFRTLLPFLILMAVGVARIFYGVSHENPVLYLVILVILTFIIGVMVASATPKLTPAGKELLAQQKVNLQATLASTRSATERNPLAQEAVALSGAIGLVAFAEYANIQTALQSVTVRAGGDASGDGGCGSSGCGSSGCGSSGCGGGGCGGGGGGGD
jgi:uncharacterized protein (TIGR04222 family)